jgi:hypothetical protein
MAQRKFVVHCERHGSQGDAKFRYTGKQVAVRAPQSKKARRAGCPICRQESLQGS